MRSQSEIVAAKQEFFDRVWHERHLVVEGMWESGEAPPEDIYRGRSKPPRTFVSGDLTYARSRSDYEWGMWNGKLSALRWVLGVGWDFLDT